MTHDDTLDLLRQKLRWLRLPGMAQLLPSLLEQAGQDNLTTLDVIDRLCDEERASRMKSAVERRIKDARFPELNTVMSPGAPCALMRRLSVDKPHRECAAAHRRLCR